MRFPLLTMLLLLSAVSHAEETQEKAVRKWGTVEGGSVIKGGSGTPGSSARSYTLGDIVKAPLEKPIRAEFLSTGRAEGQPEGAALAKVRLTNPNPYPVVFEARLNSEWGIILAGEEIKTLKEGLWKCDGWDFCGTGRSLHSLATNAECEITVRIPRREGLRILATFYREDAPATRSRIVVFEQR